METPLKQPGKHGGQLNVGNPGNKGGGRIPGSFREDCRRVSQETLPVIERIVKGTAQRGDSKPSFADSRAAWSDIAKMGYGEAKVLLPEEFVPALGKVLGKHPEISLELIAAIAEELIEELKGL